MAQCVPNRFLFFNFANYEKKFCCKARHELRQQKKKVKTADSEAGKMRRTHARTR